jgi:hypothetical protein
MVHDFPRICTAKHCEFVSAAGLGSSSAVSVLLVLVRLFLWRAQCNTLLVANTMERCSLFLPLRWGAGPMALMLWLNLVI